MNICSFYQVLPLNSWNFKTGHKRVKVGHRIDVPLLHFGFCANVKVGHKRKCKSGISPAHVPLLHLAVWWSTCRIMPLVIFMFYMDGLISKSVRGKIDNLLIPSQNCKALSPSSITQLIPPSSNRSCFRCTFFTCPTFTLSSSNIIQLTFVIRAKRLI